MAGWVGAERDWMNDNCFRPGGGSLSQPPVMPPARAPVGVARRAKRARTARRGRAGCSRRARRPPRRGRRWGRTRRPGAPAGRRRAKYEGRVRSPRRRVRGRRTCPGASSARPCARRPGPGRGARRAAAPPWPSWAPTGASRSRQKPPARVCRYLGQFWSFSLVFSSRCWHSGSSRRRDAREGDRGHTGAATAPPVASGQSLSGRAGPPKIQSTPTARGRRFGADLAAFRRGRDEYGPPPPKIHPRKGRGPRVAPLSGTPAAPVRAARWRGINNSRPRFSRAAAPSRSAAASHLGAAGSCTWCAVESAGVQGVPRLVPARGGRRER